MFSACKKLALNRLLTQTHLALKTTNLNLKIIQKKRVGIYVKSNIETVRRSELEGIDSNLVIIDIRGKQNFCLINVHSCFNPTNGMCTKQL